MTTTEIGVAVVGLLLGYWLVSFFMKSGRPSDPRAGAPDTQPMTEPMTEPMTVPMASPAPWCAVLQLAPDATIEEIRAAYFRLAAQYHPDKVRDLGPEIRDVAARKLADIETAYQEALRGHGVGA